MQLDAPEAIAEWVDEVESLLPEITIGEIDARRSPHAIPISGWRRFTGALASVLAGIVLAVAIGWLGWQAVQTGDRALERLMGPEVAPTVAPTTIAEPVAAAPQEPSLTWTAYGPLDGLPVGTVTALAIDPDGSAWTAIAAWDGPTVAHLVDGAWTVVEVGLEEVEGAPRWLTVTGNGSVWMAVTTPDGAERIYGYEGEAWTPAVDVDFLGSVVLEGPYGQLWVAAIDDRLRPTRLERSQGRWIVARADAAFPIDGVESVDDVVAEDLAGRVALDPEGVAWFAADGAVIKFDGRRTGLIESIDDSWISVGPQGDVWVPIPHGLRRYHDSVWTYHDARHGLPGTPPVAGSLRFSDSAVWTAFRMGVVLHGYTFDGATWSETTTPPPGSGLRFEPGYRPQIAFTPVALGGDDDSVWIRSDHSWHALIGADSARVSAVQDACRAPDGTLWIAAAGRLRSVLVGK